MRQNAVAAWLEQHHPDLVFLQEIKCVDDNFPVSFFAERGYHAVVHGQPAYNGVAILSREKSELVSNRLQGDPDDTQARYLEIIWRDCHFINLYAPNGNPLGTEKFTYKLAWLERLRQRFEQLVAARIPFVAGGDYNIIPEKKDARHPEQWLGDALYQPESHAAWRGLQWCGTYDAFRLLHPDDSNSFTFWDYQAGAWQQDNGIRIDHFLLSPQMADRLRACHIDKEPRGKEKPSDHTIIVAQFDS